MGRLHRHLLQVALAGLVGAACLAVPPSAGAATYEAEMVKDVHPGFNHGFEFNPQFTKVGSTVFFVADDGVHGPELWKSNGAGSGTSLVKDINPGASAQLSGLTNVGGTLFFKADDGAHGRELWKSDGTADGTVMVKDIDSGTAGGEPSYLTNLDGVLYFTAYDGTDGELWRSDGTAEGTTVVKVVNPTSLSNLANVGGTLFFVARDIDSNAFQLWKSNGTEAGTGKVKDIGQTSFPSLLTNVGGTLFFVAFDFTDGQELWKSDGTADGTVMVKDIKSGDGGSEPRDFTDVGGTLYFAADDGVHGWELWRSDGTSLGTTMVRDINPGAGGSGADRLIDVEGTLYLGASDGTSGSELWKSDGTSTGTTMVKDIDEGADGSMPGDPQLGRIADVNGTVLLSASDGAHGVELWASDGTEQGTTMVSDIRPEFGSNPYGLTSVDGTLFFVADNDTEGRELWKASAATAIERTLSVAKTGAGQGTVASSPAGIDCGEVCTAGFDGGTEVTLTATPDSGFSFAGWSGDCSGTGTCAVTMDADRSVTASFVAAAPAQYALTVTRSGDGAGTVTSAPLGIDCGSHCASQFDQGTEVTLSATPDAGSTFAGWSGGGCSGAAQCTVTMSSGRAITATFVSNPLSSAPAGPTPPPASAPGPTGRRAAALKKCKRKKRSARKRCAKRARRLPI